MKPFDLEAAKRGEPIVTRDGRKAKFVAYVPEAEEFQQVLILIDSHIWSCNSKGEAFAVDLRMAPSPPMRSINGHEYPEPERVESEEGTRYWCPSHLANENVYASSWYGTPFDMLMLRRGLVHLTREAAEAHARAIILAGGGEV